jgi:hypothetical protein
MSKLLEEMIQKIRELPEDMQDIVAEGLVRYLQEIQYSTNEPQ